MERGYFPVFRKIFDSDVWRNDAVLRVWIYILGNVSYEPTKTCSRYQYAELEPGQMIIGRKNGAKNCGVTERSFRTTLKYLKSTSRIATKTTNRFTIISVINWQSYRDAQLGNDQQSDHQSDQQVTSRCPASDHIKELKKLRIKKTYSVDFQKFWSGYPRPVQKQVAFEKWETALKEEGVTADHLLRAALEYSSQCEDRKTEERFIMHPATFLFKGRWKDYCFREDV